MKTLKEKDIVNHLYNNWNKYFPNLIGCRKEFTIRDSNSHITYFYYTKSNNSENDFIIQEEELSEVKWFDIDKIVFSDGTIPGKPAPDIFLIAAEKIGLAPKNCVVIEDAIAGIKSAQAAGIGKVVAIASLEPINFYKQIDGIETIIKNFYEFDTKIFN